MNETPQFLVINLDRSPDRLAIQKKQFELLGLDFERIAAVDGEKLTQAEVARYATRTERELSSTEVACLLSHKLCWKRVADSVRGAVVLEDDAVVAPEIKKSFSAMTALSGADVVNLETRHGRRFLSTKPAEIAHGDGRFFELLIGTSGATAYFLTPLAAELLLRHVERKARIADTYINTLRGIRRLQADPALAVQMSTLVSHLNGTRWDLATTTIRIMARHKISGWRGFLLYLRSRVYRGVEQVVLLGQKLWLGTNYVRRIVPISTSMPAHYEALRAV